MEPKSGDRRQSVMTSKCLTAVVVLGFLLAQGCGAANGGLERHPRSAKNDDHKAYEATGLVLQDQEHGALLCLGVVLTSLPPQCGSGDVRVRNWDWDQVRGEERRGGTIWGRYHVTGVFEGESFTVTKVGPAPKEQFGAGGDPVGTPCREPKDGWQIPDPDKTGEGDVVASNAAVSDDPEFAGLWITHLDATAKDEARILLNAAFTANLEGHEQELRKHWGGPLCVVDHDRSMKRLEQIQSVELVETIRELGLQLMSTDIDVEDNVVELGVVRIDAEQRDLIADRFGARTVRVVAALQPAS